jgi:cytosine permease
LNAEKDAFHKMKLKYSDQNFYHLFCIQSVGLGIPVIIIGKQLSVIYGISAAVSSILVGNLILWLVGLTIVSMVYQEKLNAIENIKGYIGKHGSFLFAVILVIAFLDWYVIQINIAVSGLESLYRYSYPWEKSLLIRMGAALGFITALLAIGGIRLLKWITSILFPLFLLYNIYIIAVTHTPLIGTFIWEPTLSGVITTVLVLLPGVINLPTFFKHSKSRANSILALTFMFVFISFFECATIWMSFSPESRFVPTGSELPNFWYFVIPTSLFLIISSIITNLLNIYLASACYETFIQRFSGTKGHAIMGLLGTAMYTFVQISEPVQFLEYLLNSYIAVLGVVLVIAVLSRIIVQHRPKKFEKTINAFSWIIGCITASTFQVRFPSDNSVPLLYGISASIVFFLIVFLVEETIWSVQKLMEKESIDNE